MSNKSRIPSPARSHGVITPRRYRPRSSRSVGSPARSTNSTRLATVIQDVFELSPMCRRRSILNDDTDIIAPGRQSWWKNLGENSREVLDVLQNKDVVEANNLIEEFDMEVLSQEKKNYSIDLQDSSDAESIRSIIIPCHKLFTEKENAVQKNYKNLIKNRETLNKSKAQKSSVECDRDISVGPKNLFSRGEKRTKPVFPAALLSVSANRTAVDKTLPPVDPKNQARNLFGRAATKRKNMFIDFIVSDSEDEIPDIQPKILTLKRPSLPQRRNSSVSNLNSPTPSITDIEMDDWRLLPSSTMVEHQLEDQTTPKQPRRSKLSDIHGKVNTFNINAEQKDKEINKDKNTTLEDPNKQNTSLTSKQKKNATLSKSIDSAKSNNAHRKDNVNITNKSLSINSSSQNAAGVKQKKSKLFESDRNKNLNLSSTRLNVSEVKNVEDDDQNICNDLNVENEQPILSSDDELENSQLHYEEDEDGNLNKEGDKTITNKNKSKVVETQSTKKNNQNILDHQNDLETYDERNPEDCDINQQAHDEIPKHIANMEASKGQNEATDSEQNESNEQLDENVSDIAEDENNTSNVQKSADQSIDENDGIDNDEDDEQHEENDEDEEDKESEVMEEESEVEPEVSEAEPEVSEVENEENEPDKSEDEEEDEDNLESDANESAHQIDNNDDDIENVHNDASDDRNENVSTEEIDSNNVNPNSEASEEIENSIEEKDKSNSKEKEVINSPEVILKDKSKQGESFFVQGRNTSVRKTKSVILKNLNIRPSLAPVRESIEFSDGARDSSANNSGWDSHRTTRKTMRQTFGKDFTPRKSLRTLVMEKSAKRQTNLHDNEDISKMPQANSTEYPQFESIAEPMEFEESVAESVRNDVEVEQESIHEISKRTRQTTLEMYLEKIKNDNMERKRKMEEEIRQSLKTSCQKPSLFKVPQKPAVKRSLKTNKPPPKKIIKHILPFDVLPDEVLEDLKYKPPKRYQPKSTSWVTKRLYKFLETKLEPQYDYKARVRAEKLVEVIFNFTKDIRRCDVAPEHSVDSLKREMARLHIVNTHFEFYEFFKNFMPRDVRNKVVPDIVNKISLPKPNVFAEIIR